MGRSERSDREDVTNAPIDKFGGSMNKHLMTRHERSSIDRGSAEWVITQFQSRAR